MISSLICGLLLAPSLAPMMAYEHVNFGSDFYLRRSNLVRRGPLLSKGKSEKWYIGKWEGNPIGGGDTDAELSPNARYWAYVTTRDRRWGIGILDLTTKKPPVFVRFDGGGDIKWSPDSTKLYVAQARKKLLVLTAQGKTLGTWQGAMWQPRWLADSKAALILREDDGFEFFPKIAAPVPKSVPEATRRVLGFTPGEGVTVWIPSEIFAFRTGRWMADASGWLEFRDPRSPVTIFGPNGFAHALNAERVMNVRFLDDSRFAMTSRGPALPEQKEIKGIGTYLTVVSLPSMKTDLFGLSGIGEEATFR